MNTPTGWPPAADIVRDMRRPQPLHEPARHEPLSAAATAGWDDAAVRATVTRIATALQAEVLAGPHPPHPATHPRDADSPGPADGYKGSYLGSAGLWWALHRLHGWGLAPGVPDLAGLMDRIAAGYRLAPDTDERVPSLFLGEVGVELLRWAATGATDRLDAIEALVRGNAENPTREGLWGAPGTMWAAWHLAQAANATDQARWVDTWLHSARALMSSWALHADAGCHLWLQDMYGRQVHYLGAGHGAVGNLHALLAGRAWLAPHEAETLLHRTAELLSATACRVDGAANWAPGLYPPRPGTARFLMQWCHGAPGFVTALAGVYPVGVEARVDTLLQEAGEAIWRAGPLTKGAGLCHGTAGNGWALLMLHRRTGDTRWFERARAMALHALAQSEAMHAEFGRWRPALWTGEPGVLLFAAQCLDGTPAMHGLPGLDGL
jgi:hypothetical protein